jgi:hypothetical protein
MSRDSDAAQIYAAVLRRVAEVDHGWGKPYAFPGLYVLDRPVPGVEEPGADLDGPATEGPFDDGLRATLREAAVDLPALAFVGSFHEVYDAQRSGPSQVRDGSGFIALGPIAADGHAATVGTMFYGARLWARWLRYHLEREDGAWRIVSSDILAVS